MPNLLTRRRQSENTFAGLVAAGKATVVTPSTDSGYVSYGAGRLFLPTVTNVCPDPQGTLADGTFWPASTANTVLTANQSLPIPIADQPLITKCLKLVNDGTADTPATANLTVTQSKDYMVSLYVFAPTLGGNLTITSETGDAHTVAALTTAGSGWTRYNVNSHTSAGQTTLHLHIAFAGGTASTVYVTGFQVAQESVLTPYGDGSYSGCAWSGTANASTSVRASSKLRYGSGIPSTLSSACTMALRSVPLYAGNDGVMHYSLSLSDGTADASGTVIHGVTKRTSNRQYTMASGGVCAYVDAASFTAGQTLSTVSRVDTLANTSDMMVNGTAGTQSTAAAGNTVTRVDVCESGGQLYNGLAYIGPVLISPTRITDAQTATLSAMLTAGATGLDLYRWCSQNGLTNTLILPLDSSSVGYLVRS